MHGDCSQQYTHGPPRYKFVFISAGSASDSVLILAAILGLSLSLQTKKGNKFYSFWSPYMYTSECTYKSLCKSCQIALIF